MEEKLLSILKRMRNNGTPVESIKLLISRLPPQVLEKIKKLTKVDYKISGKKRSSVILSEKPAKKVKIDASDYKILPIEIILLIFEILDHPGRMGMFITFKSSKLLTENMKFFYEIAIASLERLTILVRDKNYLGLYNEIKTPGFHVNTYILNEKYGDKTCGVLSLYKLFLSKPWEIGWFMIYRFISYMDKNINIPVEYLQKSNKVITRVTVNIKNIIDTSSTGYSVENMFLIYSGNKLGGIRLSINEFAAVIHSSEIESNLFFDKFDDIWADLELIVYSNAENFTVKTLNKSIMVDFDTFRGLNSIQTSKISGVCSFDYITLNHFKDRFLTVYSSSLKLNSCERLGLKYHGSLLTIDTCKLCVVECFDNNMGMNIFDSSEIVSVENGSCSALIMNSNKCLVMAVDHIDIRRSKYVNFESNSLNFKESELLEGFLKGYKPDKNKSTQVKIFTNYNDFTNRRIILLKSITEKIIGNSANYFPSIFKK